MGNELGPSYRDSMSFAAARAKLLPALPVTYPVKASNIHGQAKVNHPQIGNETAPAAHRKKIGSRGCGDRLDLFGSSWRGDGSKTDRRSAGENWPNARPVAGLYSQVRPQKSKCVPPVAESRARHRW